MKRYSRNILVIAENNGAHEGFNVFLEFSGQREYLFTHRHNGVMFNLLKDGIRLDDLHRGIQMNSIPVPFDRRSGHAASRLVMKSMRYMMVVIDDYITDREQCA